MHTNTPTVPPPAVGDMATLTSDEVLAAAIDALAPAFYPGPHAAKVRSSLRQAQQDHVCAGGRCLHLGPGQPECPDAHWARHLLAVL